MHILQVNFYSQNNYGMLIKCFRRVCFVKCDIFVVFKLSSARFSLVVLITKPHFVFSLFVAFVNGVSKRLCTFLRGFISYVSVHIFVSVVFYDNFIVRDLLMLCRLFLSCFANFRLAYMHFDS